MPLFSALVIRDPIVLFSSNYRVICLAPIGPMFFK